MEIVSIKTEKDYDLALERVNILFDAKSNTNEANELNFLVTLIEEYERIHYPISDSN